MEGAPQLARERIIADAMSFMISAHSFVGLRGNWCRISNGSRVLYPLRLGRGSGGSCHYSCGRGSCGFDLGRILEAAGTDQAPERRRGEAGQCHVGMKERRHPDRSTEEIDAGWPGHISNAAHGVIPIQAINLPSSG